MIELNFINPNEQSDIQKDRIILFVRELFFLLLITIAISASLLLGGRNILRSSMADITDSSTGIAIISSEASVSIKKVNEKLRTIKGIQSTTNEWSSTLAQISSVIPKGNKLTSIVLDTKENTISLTGHSNKRENLLEMKKVLENHPLISGIDVPISNLLSKENIEFEIKIEISQESLKTEKNE